jgi:transposase
MIGIDLAKHVFQLHGAAADGTVLFRRRLRREKLLDFLGSQPPSVVAMEACASAHYWGREIGRLGHEVRLVAPAYVKPFVKRQKNDTADAEAICGAAGRPTMRFVAVKSEAQQASAMIFKGRDLLVRQRTATINALRGHLAEFGIIAPKGPAHVGRLQAVIQDEPNSLPDPARALCQDLLEVITNLSTRISALDHEIGRRARQDDTLKRLMTIPGIGPVIATPVEALAPLDVATTCRPGREAQPKRVLGAAEDAGPFEPVEVLQKQRVIAQEEGVFQFS